MDFQELFRLSTEAKASGSSTAEQIYNRYGGIDVEEVHKNIYEYIGRAVV